MEVSKSLRRKKGKEDKQTLADLSSVHRLLQGKCQLVEPVTSNKVIFLVCHIIFKHLINQA